MEKIEGYSSSHEKKCFTIDDSEEIESILEILDDSNEVEEAQIENPSLSESYYLECYKPLVEVIKSEDRKLFTLFFYRESNIVRAEIASEDLNMPSFTRD